ncbi:MAG: hypothetical protein OEU95_07385, partial [Nitrospirota bacterium]|nr:hypothetical protein [Nitrospirota bacterium]
MKKIITVLLITALIVFSAYFTFKKVKDRSGSMVSHVVKEQPASVSLPVTEEALSQKTGNKTISADEVKEKKHLGNRLPASDEGLNAEDKETLETLLAEDMEELPKAEDSEKKDPVSVGKDIGKMLSSAVERLETMLAEDTTETPDKGAPAAAEEDQKVEAGNEAEKPILPAAAAEEEGAGAALPAKEVREEPVKQGLPAEKGQNAEDKERVDTLPAAAAEEKADVLPAQEDKEEPVKQVLPVSEKWSSAEAGKRIAILSFDNFSDDAAALDQIMPALKERLEKKGLTVVGERRVSRFLCDERIRFTNYISNETVRKVRDKFMVRTILAGSVVSYSSKDTPQVGLILRLIDSSSGSIVWANFVSVSGDDFASVLGLGKIKKMDDLIPRALDRLFASFSVSPVRMDTESVYRIVVLPFQNKSKFSNAGMITMYMFIVELFKNYKFEPIEYGEVRKLIVDLRVRNKGELEYKSLEALSEAVNISGVLVGTVERYSAGTDASLPVNVAITARLLDARKNRILWYNSHESNGEKKIISFEWGGARPVDRVAYEVV